MSGLESTGGGEVTFVLSQNEPNSCNNPGTMLIPGGFLLVDEW